MAERHLVEFVEPAAREIPDAFKDVLRPELAAIFTRDEQRPARAITVSRSFTGYAPDISKSVVLGVGVRFDDGFESHIVKIGRKEKVESDWTGWNACTAGRDVASRILHAPRPYDLSKDDRLPKTDRFAVIYRDAYMLFGGYGEKTRVETLETVVEWAVKDNPDPVSVERVICHLFTDLGRWFYADGRLTDDRGRAFYEGKLLTGAKAEVDRVLTKWCCTGGARRPDPVALRRDAIWLLCGKERPENLADLVPTYLDPVSYVRWALDTNTLPETLVGRSHGDLHGRNILLGVEREEAQYPVIIDYGTMRPDNVIVWDFVKLETELKVRMLTKLYREPKIRDRLLHDSARKRTGPASNTDRGRRADRLEFAYFFERQLAERTEQILSRDDAARREPPGGRGVLNEQTLDRLLEILLRIRQEAALVLGHDRSRMYDWREEYYFALTVYGLMSVKWDYEPQAAECALVAAGVAAARLTTTQQSLRDLMAQPPQDEAVLCPCYRVPLFQAHRLWQEGKAAQGLKLLEVYRPLFSHAVPLEQEYALLLSEVGKGAEAQKLVLGFQEGCKVFGDHETLSRLGRTYKNAGDAAWGKWYRVDKESGGVPQGSPAWQQYHMALLVYEEAFELTDDYYPGVNAASLALLLGEAPRATRLARRVAELCWRPDILKREDTFWVFATEGEAALVLGKYAEAFEFYQNALDHSGATVQPVQAAYHQLCRLWHVLDQKELGRLVDVLFAGHATWESIQPGPVGGCGGRK